MTTLETWTCPQCGRKNNLSYMSCANVYKKEKFNGRPWYGCHWDRELGELGPNGEILSKYKGNPNDITPLGTHKLFFDV